VKLTKGQVRDLEAARAALLVAHRKAYPVLRNVDVAREKGFAREFDSAVEALIEILDIRMKEHAVEVDAVVEAFISVPPALADPEG
jgi:hypothetical protein